MQLIRKLVLKNMKLNRKRTVVTIVGITLAIALLVALFTLVSSFRLSMILFEKSKAGDYHLKLAEVNRTELDEIKANRDIESMYIMNELGYARITESKNPDKPYAFIMGTDQEGIRKAYLKLVEGRLPENDHEVLIPKHLYSNGRVEYKVGDKLSLQVGRRVDMSGQYKFGQDVMYNAQEEQLVDTKTMDFTVVGIIDRPGYALEDRTAPGYTFITYSDTPTDNMEVFLRLNSAGIRNSTASMAKLCQIDPDLAVKIFDENNYSVEEYEEYCKQLGEAPFVPSINSWLISYERVWPIDSSLKVVGTLAAIVALIIMLTSIYCIKNSFDISISEKIRQFGMLASVGATKRQIRKSVHLEAAYMGLVGIPLGTFFGVIAAYILIWISNVLLEGTLTSELIFFPSLVGILFAVMLGIITIYFSAQGSARKASRVSPMEAIRNQKEIKFNRKSIKTPWFVETLWGIGGVISYKNIKRNKKKYRTTTVSIIICTVTFIVTSYFMSMMFDMVGDHVNTDEANVTVDIESASDFDRFCKDAKASDKFTQCSIFSFNSIVEDNLKQSEEYVKTLDYYGYEGTDRHNLVLCAMEDASFDAYAKQQGVSAGKGKAILVSEGMCVYLTENGEIKSGQAILYENTAGDLIKFHSSDEQSFETIIGAIAAERPLGYVAYKNEVFLVMRYSDLLAMNFPISEDVRANYKSENADALQDDLEKLLTNNDNNSSPSIKNNDKAVRQNRSLILLLEIFAYGLIIVIALIGITNIINTLGTSMELRARDFATLRSVGMTSGQFERMVRLESLFTGGKALIIGIIIGNVLSYMINRYETTESDIIIYHPPLTACLLSVVVVMVLIYAIIKTSLGRINKRNIIDTIKNENL